MRFKVGDAVVLVDPTGDWVNVRECIGLETTILALPGELRYGRFIKTAETYVVAVAGARTVDGSNVCDILSVLEHHMRLRRPPSWDSWLYDTSQVRDSRPVEFGV